MFSKKFVNFIFTTNFETYINFELTSNGTCFTFQCKFFYKLSFRNYGISYNYRKKHYISVRSAEHISLAATMKKIVITK